MLRLYAPKVESEAIAPKAVRRRNGWFRPGKLPRLLLDVLRTAPAPLSVKALSVEPMKRRGLDPEDARTVHRVGKMVHDCLARQSAGLVERVSDGKAAAWKAAQ
ncbi:hypothetical protein [Azospirillum sp. SYSU D00513]|uniref:hypothetical protein n=1 Tax=Azospirillum sp. SYSU D00513 TaxID=2812561 RepID=UPI001A96D254|nr:hypothetical protein [Azospirillum sp. SYSU D00513]